VGGGERGGGAAGGQRLEGRGGLGVSSAAHRRERQHRRVRREQAQFSGQPQPRASEQRQGGAQRDAEEDQLVSFP